MKSRLFALIGSLVVAFSFSGCFESTNSITINNDGSGSVEEIVAVSPQMLAMMAGFGDVGKQLTPGDAKPDGDKPAPKAAPKAPANPLMDRAQWEKHAAKMGAEVKLASVTPYKSASGFEGVKVSYTFPDVRKIKLNIDEDVISGMMGDNPIAQDALKEAKKKERPPMTFSLEGKKLTINMPGNLEGLNLGDINKLAGEGGKEIDPSQLAMAKAMFAGMKMAWTVKCAGGIAKTDAEVVDGAAVTLVSMDFAEFFDLDNIKKLQAVSGEKVEMEKVRAVLKTIKGLKAETKPKVEIDLK